MEASTGAGATHPATTTNSITGAATRRLCVKRKDLQPAARRRDWIDKWCMIASTVRNTVGRSKLCEERLW